ncbi:UNVERIFIED_CONTAM: hypothetical protein FKN15_068279 [Acipenser sinensis]
MSFKQAYPPGVSCDDHTTDRSMCTMSPEVIQTCTVRKITDSSVVNQITEVDCLGRGFRMQFLGAFNTNHLEGLQKAIVRKARVRFVSFLRIPNPL